MLLESIPPKAQEALLQDAARRDPTTARRLALLKILLHEHFLTRAQLIRRVEASLGKDCFGALAWADTFYRDMRAVKEAFYAAGYALRYSRSDEQAGYYLLGQPRLSPELSRIVEAAYAEADPAQIRIFRQLPPAERVRMGCSISDAARQAVAYRIRQRQPK